MSFTTTPDGFATNAPKVGQAFDQAKAPANDAARQAFIAKRQAEQAQHQQTPSTKAELDQRIAQRTPKTTLALTPDGSIRQSVDRTAQAENEDRIRFIEGRLNAARNAPKRDFSQSR